MKVEACEMIDFIFKNKSQKFQSSGAVVARRSYMGPSTNMISFLQCECRGFDPHLDYAFCTVR